MSEVELIATALTAGLSSGVTTTASTAVKDAYTSLRDAVRRRLSRQSGGPGEEVLDTHVADPTGVEERLVEALRSVQADQDHEIVTAAHRFLALVNSPSMRNNKHTIWMPDAKGVQIGDNNKQEISFG